MAEQPVNKLSAEEAVTQVQGALKALADPDVYDSVHEYEPDILIPGDFGKCILAFTFLGAEDDGRGLASSLVPRYLSFRARIYHQSIPSEDETDGYVRAQKGALSAGLSFYTAVRQNPTLDGRVMDSLIQSLDAGPVQERNGETFYAHEYILVYQIH